MSKRASPTAIGLFMIGALVLIVAGIATFASTTWFNERTTFVSSFDESVNGLVVGAPVKFKGVPVGRVTELLIRIDLSDETFRVPVLYEVDLSMLTTEADRYLNLADREVLLRQVDEGLRAQLQLESFVTGQLYIELTYVSETDSADLATGVYDYPRIPTEPSLLTAFGEEAGGLVSSLQSVDVSSISRNLVELLVTANEKLSRLDVVAVNESLVEASESIEQLAETPEIRQALREVPVLADQFNQTLVEVQRLSEQLGGAVEPVQGQLETTNEEAVATLRALRESVEQMQLLLAPESGLNYRLKETLESLSEAAEALRQLAQSLEQNPSMLIRGKQQPDE